jgi:hypothetical protein
MAGMPWSLPLSMAASTPRPTAALRDKQLRVAVRSSECRRGRYDGSRQVDGSVLMSRSARRCRGTRTSRGSRRGSILAVLARRRLGPSPLAAPPSQGEAAGGKPGDPRADPCRRSRCGRSGDAAARVGDGGRRLLARALCRVAGFLRALSGPPRGARARLTCARSGAPGGRGDALARAARGLAGPLGRALQRRARLGARLARLARAAPAPHATRHVAWSLWGNLGCHTAYVPARGTGGHGIEWVADPRRRSRVGMGIELRKCAWWQARDRCSSGASVHRASAVTTASGERTARLGSPVCPLQCRRRMDDPLPGGDYPQVR